MSKREQTAIEVLKSGGFFRYQLERNFRGHEQFTTRLIAADRSVVKGIGHSTKHALASMLARRECHYGSRCTQEWVLA